jgi:putative membrane protein
MPASRQVLRGLAWLLFVLLALRFAALWADAFAGTSLPFPGSIGFTLLFTAFSVLHAASLLGWRRSLAFLLVCAVVSWCFEEVGVSTGLVYGAYHYGNQLGPKLGEVPLIIPLAWFMMVYASWTVARLLLDGAGSSTSGVGTAARIVIAAMVMTAWDSVMDPGMARSGAWTWEQGGAYFGVPLQNFAGWLATTVTVYALAELLFRRLGGGPPIVIAGVYAGLPAILYALIAADRLLLPGLPELRVVAAFGMGFVALLAILRLALGPPTAVPPSYSPFEQE